MDNNTAQTNYNTRNITQEEKDRLKKKYAIKRILLGTLLLLIGAVGYISITNHSVETGDGVKVYSVAYKAGAIFFAIGALGAYYLIEVIKRLNNINKMNVVYVSINKLIKKNKEGFGYVAYVQHHFNGAIITLEVPVLREAVNDIEKNKQGKLFFFGNTGYIIDKL